MVTKNNNNLNQQMPKSAVTALLLCAFLGWLGIHRFSNFWFYNANIFDYFYFEFHNCYLGFYRPIAPFIL